MFSKFQLTSFEDTSVVRKVTILYFLMSIVPVGVLYYLYLMVKETGGVSLSEPQFAVVLAFVVCGVGVGYAALRKILSGVVNLTKSNTDALVKILDSSRTVSATLDASGDCNEIAVLTRSFNELITRLEENERNLELARKTLHSVLSRIGEGVFSMENIDNFLDVIVQTMTEAMDGRAGILFLVDDSSGNFYVKARYGCTLSEMPAKQIYRDDGLFCDILRDKQPVVISCISGASILSPVLESPVLAAPLVLHEDVVGVMLVSGRLSDENFSSEDAMTLHHLALQTAIALEHSKLNADQDRTYLEAVSALAMAVEARDPHSRGHLNRVGDYAVRIADQMRLPGTDVAALRHAARLHDIGKIAVVGEVLSRSDALSREESEQMRRHPIIGEGIIRPIASLNYLCDMIRHHHERLDGSGYPDGLKGEEISLTVRILMIADIFDGLTSHRPDRDAMSIPMAIAALRKMQGRVDQAVVDALQEVV